jgi:hypothetical protein
MADKISAPGLPAAASRPQCGFGILHDLVQVCRSRSCETLGDGGVGAEVVIRGRGSRRSTPSPEVVRVPY